MGEWRLTAAAAAAALLFGAELPAQKPSVAPAAAAQPGPQVTADLLIGRWTDNDDCNEVVEFHRDGRFRTSDGVEGRWSLAGDRLSFIGERTVSARLTAPDRDHLVLTHDDGSVGRSSRCSTSAPAPRQVTMPPLPATIEQAVAMSRPFERSLLFGRWTDTGDCSEFIDFLADGRFVIANGGGTWTLVGERLTFTGESTIGVQARAVGRDRILLIHDDRTLGQSIRC